MTKKHTLSAHMTILTSLRKMCTQFSITAHSISGERCSYTSMHIGVAWKFETASDRIYSQINSQIHVFRMSSSTHGILHTHKRFIDEYASQEIVIQVALQNNTPWNERLPCVIECVLYQRKVSILATRKISHWNGENETSLTQIMTKWSLAFRVPYSKHAT